MGETTPELKLSISFLVALKEDDVIQDAVVISAEKLEDLEQTERVTDKILARVDDTVLHERVEGIAELLEHVDHSFGLLGRQSRRLNGREHPVNLTDVLVQITLAQNFEGRPHHMDGNFLAVDHPLVLVDDAADFPHHVRLYGDAREGL